ncbi:2OG-Fe(II) oxygenase [Hyphococcus luteus]|uniref:Proline hydroxylase n=1 Tax=Hyphococcus luteus TaxID=2058213 RepID=A0A2S7K2H7_9PROT|nr:2OG-Fe(II) oxygenase [Marinicaulis flavus]PQA86695.1 proline hydroxylase [Marinicaulis flavus]
MSASLRLVHPPEDLDSERWDAVLRRDASADGTFWTCVKTTGVYCLPSCSGRPKRENVFFTETRAEAEAAGFRPCKRCRPDRFLIGGVKDRIDELDWGRAHDALNTNGWAALGRLLSDEDCAGLINAYEEDALYRSRVVMRRHGFGEGEYRYFADPAPQLVSDLRTGLYEKLAPLANEWAKALKQDRTYPHDHAAYRRRCAKAGQKRPTPLILKYGPGDYNRLHQDLYGGEVFPIQIAILLSQPGRDFEGGEFVMTEQTPRRQSRAMVAPLEKGSAIAFAVNERPLEGARGTYRVKMRHGVSEVRSGARYCLGVIFHDAA